MVDVTTHPAPLVTLSKASVTVDGKSLLSDIDLTICEGESVVVLGANGAGKSTLLKLCNALIAPSLGSARTLPVSEQSLIFQRPALLQRTVLDNVRFVLSIHGVAEPARTQQAQRALAACNLSAAAERGDAKKSAAGRSSTILPPSKKTMRRARRFACATLCVVSTSVVPSD